MFNTTLRYLNLIILPHPSFDVPLSEADPVFRTYGTKWDNLDTIYISQNQTSQFGPIGFSTPRKPVSNQNSLHKRRRNTICCYSCHCLADSVPANEDISVWPVNISSNFCLSSDTSEHNPYQESIPDPSASTRVKPHDPPSPSSCRSGKLRITSFFNFSDSSDDRVMPEKVRDKGSRCSSSKVKKKRKSVPPAVTLQFGIQNSGAIDITSMNELQSIEPPDTSQSLPTLLRKDRQKLQANSISPYTLKQFEIGLSPIIEDTHIFPNTSRAPKCVEKKPVPSYMVDSSESSYGDLIENKNKAIDYLSTSEYETIGGLEWAKSERSNQPGSARFHTDHRGDRYWNDEFWETFEDSSLIPELTLTAPTPEMRTSAMFHSEEQPSEPLCDDLHYQRPDAKFVPETATACRPNRLGHPTALASTSKALTGTDMLLGVGNGVFDSMFDAGVICNNTSRLPESAAAHSGGHLGNNWSSSLATQSLGNGEAKTGFLWKLLRRKSTEGSKVSERRGRVWKRVSRNRWSGRFARDQENSIATAPVGPPEESYGPVNTSRGWKRFSRIFANVTVSSRRRSQFTVDPLEGGCRDSGNTRRHGLDILSDSAAHV